jgi:hypothetical protein
LPFIFCVHDMQRHMVLKKLAPLLDLYSVTFQMPQFSLLQWPRSFDSVLHIVKNGDDAPIFLLWQ